MSESEVDRITDNVSPISIDPSLVTTSAGVKLRLKRFNRVLLVDAKRKLVVPKPPTVWMEEKGREEENPNHPAYIEALARYRDAENDLGINIALVLGTEVLEVPPGIQGIDDIDWAHDVEDSLQDAGISLEIPPKGNRRKLAWLKYYAIPDEIELMDLVTTILSFDGGVVAQKVLEAIDSFRNSESGDTVIGVGTTKQAEPRNNNDRANRRANTRVRRT